MHQNDLWLQRHLHMHVLVHDIIVKWKWESTKYKRMLFNICPDIYELIDLIKDANVGRIVKWSVYFTHLSNLFALWLTPIQQMNHVPKKKSAICFQLNPFCTSIWSRKNWDKTDIAPAPGLSIVTLWSTAANDV